MQGGFAEMWKGSGMCSNTSSPSGFFTFEEEKVSALWDHITDDLCSVAQKGIIGLFKQRWNLNGSGWLTLHTVPSDTWESFNLISRNV